MIVEIVFRYPEHEAELRDPESLEELAEAITQALRPFGEVDDVSIS